MLKNQLITPEGTKDYLFDEAVARRKTGEKLRTLFESRGYHEVITPGLEFLDVFFVHGHGIPIEHMYKLTDQKGRLMVLRPDSTMPIARLCATRLKEKELPLRLFYQQPLYSANKTLRGRADELMQAGVELIGSSSKKADLEILSFAAQALTLCEPKNFRLELGHIGIFNTLVSRLCLDEMNKEELRLAIEAKNDSALENVLQKIPECKESFVLRQLPRLFGGEEIFEQAADFFDDGKTRKILSSLQECYESLCVLGLKDHLAVDLGIVNRTDYYTGIVFKGYMEGYGEPLLSGGRYDTLLSQYGRNTGAIGFAINIDAAARAYLSTVSSFEHTSAAIVYSEERFTIEAIKVVNQLSSQGIPAELSLFHSLEETIQYSSKAGISQVIQVDGNGQRKIKGDSI